MTNTIIWADIPVKDMGRARKFYSQILEADVNEMPGTEGTISLLPGGDQEGVVSADLALNPDMKPCADGVTIYLDGEPDASILLGRVEEAGGKILQRKQFMGDTVGAIAFFLDSEGNRIGIRSRS